jgi:ferredoxin-NADP reductase
MAKRRVCDAWMETHNVRTIRFDFRDEPISFLPGQFLVVADCFRGYSKPIRRAYSIASSPLQREFVDLTIKRESPGLMSVRLTEAPIGIEFDVTGPSGKFCYAPEMGPRVLLLGAGSGITPLYSIARFMLDGGLDGADVNLFFSVKTPRDVIYDEEWGELSAAHSGFRFHLTATRATPAVWQGRHGRITTDWILENVSAPEECVAFICGPGPFVATMEAVCEELGLPQDRVHAEKW